MTLVIMAAGMGSRYGGLKQIDPVGPNGEFIIDYSVYDAIKAGFDKVVFIIKEENYDIFKDTIGKRVEKQISVEYVFQKNDNIPLGYSLPTDRVKPLGTSHAILCCKDIVKDNFAIINADDFYGKNAYITAADFLKNAKDDDCAVVGYQVKNTLTENGSVKRGICAIEDGYLTKLIESCVEKNGDTITATPLDGEPSFNIDGDTPVSMNMMCFTPAIFKHLEKLFTDFFEENKDNLLKCEFLIPDSVFKLIKEENYKAKILYTDSKWYGVTYKEDKEMVVEKIGCLINNGEYPNNLWK